MTPLESGMLGASLLVLQILFLGCTDSQDFGEQCLAEFKRGRDDFILDTDESVQHGATFISSPIVERYKDCVRSCCKDPRCNVAVMESGEEEGLIKSCFLFDCLYKKKYVCRFVRKKGYINYIRDAVYESYLAVDAAVAHADDRPPVANGGSDRVVQPQDSVTLNGMESLDDHGIDSFNWEQVSGETTAIIETTNFADQVIVSNLTSGVYKFRLTVVDTIGQTDSTDITVLVLTPEQSEHHCMAPMKIGPCRGAFPRWHYNAASEKCEEFTFGGCRENLNNYLSAQECANACLGSEKSSPSSRGLPIPGPTEICGVECTAGQFTCDSGCCLDPGLECDKEKQCSDGSDEANCDHLNDKFRILLQIPLDEQKVRCTEPPNTGICRDSLTKWYYNPLHQDCFRFNYGGCMGNENRFDTKEACKRNCKGVTEKDVFARGEAFERQVSGSETGIIAIAALLGISILILLGVLGYCFLKGKKRQPQRHQRVAVNGSQATTTEDTDRLVYNTTTKPI